MMNIRSVIFQLSSITPFNNQLSSYFSKYISKSRTKRSPLTSKKAGKGYNKGYGARKGGYVNSKGIATIKIVNFILIFLK
jgi:hypothetical protein